MSKDRFLASRTELSREHQETIEDLLYRLLYPIGIWREQNTKPSKGRRWTKSQLRNVAASGAKDGEKSSAQTPSSSLEPEVLKHLTIGFNSTMRCLEALGKASLDTKNLATEQEATEKPGLRKLAVVFICRSTVPTPVAEPLAFAVKRISDIQRYNGDSNIRLVYLSKNAETRMADAVGLPRIGVIGVEEGPPARILVDYVRENVQPPV
ncbi:RNase P and RNase MRP subunit [Microsporum audouinii]